MSKNIHAFPRPHSGATQYAQEGMTLRDYFAAKAMQAILTGQYPITRGQDAEVKIAAASYQMADAMMKAREQ